MSEAQSEAGRGRPLVVRMLSKLTDAFRKTPAVVDPVEVRIAELEAVRERILARDDYNPQDGRLHPEYEQLVRDGKDHWPNGSKDYGPYVRITASCSSCAYYRHEEIHRSVTGEADTHTRTSSCTHPSVSVRKLHGSENTPPWCPYFSDYLKLYVGRLTPLPKPETENLGAA
ncbi:hypothetical protein HFN89_02165 [Rhizobium laguerreae]|nr:hypothetical protein [Rhizobium laguerreae]